MKLTKIVIVLVAIVALIVPTLDASAANRALLSQAEQPASGLIYDYKVLDRGLALLLLGGALLAGGAGTTLTFGWSIPTLTITRRRFGRRAPLIS